MSRSLPTSNSPFFCACSVCRETRFPSPLHFTHNFNCESRFRAARICMKLRVDPYKNRIISSLCHRLCSCGTWKFQIFPCTQHSPENGHHAGDNCLIKITISSRRWVKHRANVQSISPRSPRKRSSKDRVK